MTLWDVIAAASLGIWLYLIFGRGGFWREGVLPPPSMPTHWPSVTAVVPARNEAAFIGEALRSLFAQDYPGDFSVILVDDHSTDGTAERAHEAAEAVGAQDRLHVIQARSLPSGWTGKLWALNEGLEEVERRAASFPQSSCGHDDVAKSEAQAPGLILLTDADIVHHRTNLRELAARIESGVDLASLMVKLRAESLAERFMIPAFVFFFEMLYPFSWIRDPARRTAGAAGGCLLVRREALRRIRG